jgi:tellurite resistance protein TehA-like permease
MKTLMITWTDIFEGTGRFFEWAFKGMKAMGQIPNIFISAFIIGLLVYWCLRIVRYRKEALRNGTIE